MDTTFKYGTFVIGQMNHHVLELPEGLKNASQLSFATGSIFGKFFMDLGIFSVPMAYKGCRTAAALLYLPLGSLIPLKLDLK